MSKKKWCGLLAILMAVSIVFTSGALRPVNVYAETIADLQEQSEEHQKKLEEINQQIEEAEASKADALEQKNLLDQQADMLHELFPDAKNVGILYCSAEANSSYQSNTIQKYLKDYGYECTEYTFADSNDIASVVNNAIATSDVLYIPTDNTAASNTTIIQNICQPAGIPIITGEEGICSGCGVATLSISYYDLGYKTGEMAYEILVNGADVSQTAVEFAPNVTKKYNVANCEALGITVPDDYVAIE